MNLYFVLKNYISIFYENVNLCICFKYGSNGKVAWTMLSAVRKAQNGDCQRPIAVFIGVPI
jgi:hypothetical protein